MFKIALFIVFIIATPTSAALKHPSVNCFPDDDINECIKSVGNGTVVLAPGKYFTSGVVLRSDITLVIPKGSVIKLADNAELNKGAFGGVANAVILAKGAPQHRLENVHIVLHGEVDGNKREHPYEKGGCEGINFAWIKNSSIKGSGTIHSANGDGIDIDAAENLIIEGVTVRDNGGSGVHFGSPRPIVGSKNNTVLNVKSFKNGFERLRNGLDLSWPNTHGAVFINCSAEGNYRNYQIDAVGGVVINSFSSGKVIKKDEFPGANYVFLNGQDMTNPDWISMKTKILFKRDIKRLLNLDYPQYLDGVEY